jgi:hypothetical protein
LKTSALLSEKLKAWTVLLAMLHKMYDQLKSMSFKVLPDPAYAAAKKPVFEKVKIDTIRMQE